MENATGIGDSILEAYKGALEGIRALERGEPPMKPEDPYLLRDVATMLIECGLRPEECSRLRWDEVRDGTLRISHGKTSNARRVIPLTPRAAATLEMRRGLGLSDAWVFPAKTRSGHIEQSTVKKQHAKACKGSAKTGENRFDIQPFPLYTFRHTCLTRWAAVMDPYTLAYLAGHSDFATTKRYVHPQSGTVLAAMQKAREASAGYNSGYSPANGESEDIGGSPAIN